ncbi:hypothetical protein ACIOMM_34795 [Streptomyces sp. NPDC087908]|uniref:hypothetical protein n=1 Tax=Streptomyces sp. NPDC087908 TaxID=3365820 RepID=UPI00381CF23E
MTEHVSALRLLMGLGMFSPRSYGSAAGAGGYEQDWRPRWDGRAGRMEVWYTTLTDPATGTGVWLHHELVSPSDGRDAFAHGWVAAFPPHGPVQCSRFGPSPWPGAENGFEARSVRAVPGVLAGRAGALSWDLVEQPVQAPLFTFPAWSWRHHLLPATHMLPAGRAEYTGTLRLGDSILHLERALGASARIYGQGNARRWGWLHADLGGGTILEAVAAVSTRPALRSLPPLVFLRLREGEDTWPRRPERSALGGIGGTRFRAELDLPAWRITGRTKSRRISVRVRQPPNATVVLQYVDPDGHVAVCHNSARSDVHVTLQRRVSGDWHPEAEWKLSGMAHAEVGLRPDDKWID